MLLPRHKVFADLYLTSSNAREAYIQAGYKDGSGSSERASKTLKRRDVQAYISQAIESRDICRIASRDEVLEMLTSSMRGEMDEEVVIAFKSHYEIVKKKISPKDRLKAAEMLAKRYGLLSENVNLNFGNKAKFAAVWAEIEPNED